MKKQSGFGAIAAIVILVILAGMSAAIVSIGTSQQMGSALDMMSVKAWQAARAGNEWGLYMALKTQNWAAAGSSCDAAAQTATLDLTADSGFQVAVSCNSWLYNEGESSPGVPLKVRIYQITAVACPATPCPAANAASATYVERTRSVIATN